MIVILFNCENSAFILHFQFSNMEIIIFLFVLLFFFFPLYILLWVSQMVVNFWK